MGNANRHSMRYVRETTYGETPADPALLFLRNTGTTLGLSKEAFESQELRPDRQIDDYRLGVEQVGGDLPFELSYESFDDLLEASLGGTWAAAAAPYAASTISAAAADNSINDSADGLPVLERGDIITIEGFMGEVTNNAEATVVSSTTSKLVVSGLILIDDAEGEGVTITQLNATLKAGVERRSFSIVRHFEDHTVDPYYTYRGVEANTLSLAVPAQGFITGSFGMIGQSQDITQDLTGLGGGTTLGASNGNSGMDSFSGQLKEGGVVNSYITAISLSLDNGLAVRNVVGSKQTILPSIDKSNLTGSIDAFFEDSTLVKKFIDELESGITFTLQDPAGNRYIVMIPRLKYSGGQPDVSSGPVPLNMPFQALRDSELNTNIKVLKIAA